MSSCTLADMASDGKLRVGIVGASGFTGAELMRLIAGHPDMELVAASGDTQAGTKVRSLYPNLAAEYGEMSYSEYRAPLFEGLDREHFVLGGQDFCSLKERGLM